MARSDTISSRAGSVLSLKTQYFLTFAVMGSLLPFLPVYLQQRGLNLTQVGYVAAAASIAVLLTPVIATYLADGKISPRRLLSGAFAISGVLLTGMLAAESFWPIMALFGLYSLAFAATTSLQDGLNFHVQRQRAASGLAKVPYHQVRVWGTVGFIVPSVLLFGFFHYGYPTQLILVSGALFCGLGLVNSFFLPQTHAKDQPDGATQLLAHGPDIHACNDDRVNRLPTLAAARAMLEPHVLVFCIAMVLAHMATAAYYTFYPVYLKDQVGLDNQWLGLIANLGVAIEIFFMLGFGWLLRHLGLKRLMVIGVLTMVARLALLATSSHIVVAAGTQLLHGMMVLIVHVVPPIFLDRHADDHYRHSMQGVYVMTVYGVGRILGNFVAGHVAAISLEAVFAYSSGLCVLATCLFVFAFHDKPTQDTRA